jgi:hypothetical protein
MLKKVPGFDAASAARRAASIPEHAPEKNVTRLTQKDAA